MTYGQNDELDLDDPAVMEALVQLGVLPAETEGLQMDLARADQKRGAMGALKGRDVGRTFVANHPLEFLAAGVQAYQGGKEEKAAREGMGKLRDQTRASLGELMRGYGRAGRRPAGPQLLNSYDEQFIFPDEE